MHAHAHARTFLYRAHAYVYHQATLTAAGRFAKDSFTIFRYERPTPGTAPEINLAESLGSLKLDKPRYDAYLKKKALEAPVRGKQLLMTI